MVRMIVSLSEIDKKWLERAGRRGGVSSAELVRRAVARLRNSEPAPDFRQAVIACAGRWKSVKKDSQAQVDGWRREWGRDA
jgi:hypothetical protein